jgi:hypothetical protein
LQHDGTEHAEGEESDGDSNGELGDDQYAQVSEYSTAVDLTDQQQVDSEGEEQHEQLKSSIITGSIKRNAPTSSSPTQTEEEEQYTSDRKQSRGSG